MQTDEAIHLPNHLGLILDGNRRWAKKHNLPSAEGHRQGYKTLKKIALKAFDMGIPYISVYIFSTENWQRSKDEVEYLMKLLVWISKNEVKAYEKENIRIVIAGMKEGLSSEVSEALSSIEKRTAANTKGTLILCFNYGGQQEIVDAAKKLLRERSDPASLTTKSFEKYLYAPDIPPIDLLVRTSGEYRLSGFMLWRAAYAELAFVDALWPDFSQQDLQTVLRYYAARQRRFGS